MYKSNQFPRERDKIKVENLPIKERADFIFKNIEDKMPKLYEFIKKANDGK